MPYVRRIPDSLSGKVPLKYVTGAEVARDIVIDYSTVSTDTWGRRLLVKGEVLCRITASGKYGPYSVAASDGRQTVSAPSGTTIQTVIANEDADVQLGHKGIGGWYRNCVFDYSELTRHDAGLTSLRTAFPTCTFDD
jgi:hypothetical protein